MKTKLNSLSFHLWCNFIAFSVIIFTVLYIIENLLFSYLYNNFEEREFTKLAVVLSSYQLNEENYNTLDTIASENNMHIIIFNNSTNDVLYISKNADLFNQNYTYDDVVDYITMGVYAPIVGSDSSVSLISNKSFIYGNRISNVDNTYIYISSPIERSSVSSAVNNVIFLITCAISLAIAGMLAVLLSRRMSRPLTRLSYEARELGKGNYDITFETEGFSEIATLGEELNSAKEELRKANDLQRELIANISHDLRTPLTVIKSYAEMIKDISGDNKDMREKHLDTIISETNRLSSLVNEVLNLSKIQSRTQSLNIEECDLKSLVLDIYNQYKLVCEENNYTVNLELIDSKIMTDKTLLGQVIANFMTNAITYTNTMITLRITEDDKSYLFELQDDGPGISDVDIDHIWDRYYRSNDNHVRMKIGTGIGLSICKNILEVMKYDYGCNTSPNGTTFYFRVDK